MGRARSMRDGLPKEMCRTTGKNKIPKFSWNLARKNLIKKTLIRVQNIKLPKAKQVFFL